MQSERMTQLENWKNETPRRLELDIGDMDKTLPVLHALFTELRLNNLRELWKGGRLVTWRVDRTGTTLDGARISSVTLSDLNHSVAAALAEPAAFAAVLSATGLCAPLVGA